MWLTAKRIRALRDFALFILGATFLWHEVFLVDQAETVIVAAGLALCISPGTLRLDAVLRRQLGVPDDPSPPQPSQEGKQS